MIDMTGLKVFNLLVLRKAGKRIDGTAKWECLCSCGHKFTTDGTSIRAGRTKSCGCLSRFGGGNRMRNGEHKTELYKIWQGMRDRCGNPNNKKYRLYGGKGISVCERWNDFRMFAIDMGDRPFGFSIDRINGDKGYSPENCRWATAIVQANNTSANKIISANGQSMTLSEWSRRTNIKANTILYRIRRGWPIEKAISVSGPLRTQ